MDCTKIGNLIRDLRIENGFTQKNIADKLNISNKTISKWERGLGCPDVSLWSELSEILNIDMVQMMDGEILENEKDNGNISKINFYICPKCNNVISSTSNASVFCCSRKLESLKSKVNEEIEISIKTIDIEYYILIDHDMTKDNYIIFTAYVKDDKYLINRMYPEQSPNVNIPYIRGGKFYIYSLKYGFVEIKEKFN